MSRAPSERFSVVVVRRSVRRRRWRAISRSLALILSCPMVESAASSMRFSSRMCRQLRGELLVEQSLVGFLLVDGAGDLGAEATVDGHAAFVGSPRLVDDRSIVLFDQVAVLVNA